MMVVMVSANKKQARATPRMRTAFLPEGLAIVTQSINTITTLVWVDAIQSELSSPTHQPQDSLRPYRS